MYKIHEFCDLIYPYAKLVNNEIVMPQGTETEIQNLNWKLG